jgi:hypothetical protein
MPMYEATVRTPDVLDFVFEGSSLLGVVPF